MTGAKLAILVVEFINNSKNCNGYTTCRRLGEFSRLSSGQGISTSVGDEDLEKLLYLGMNESGVLSDKKGYNAAMGMVYYVLRVD